MSCVQTLFCTKTPHRFSRAEATHYAAEMCIGLSEHRRLETTICCLCRHDILCVRALFGLLLAIKDLRVLWRQQLCRANDVNFDNQHYGYGLWVGILASLAIPYTPVRPVVWKKTFSLGKDKEQSRLRAQQLFPVADLRLRKHHGRAESLLLAYYGLHAWGTDQWPMTADVDCDQAVGHDQVASPKNRRNLLRQPVFPLLISPCEDNQKTWVK